MSFGGLAPFPLRLGPSSDTSTSPEEWLRVCADIASIRHPLAVLDIEEPVGAGACTVTGLARGGTVTGITATKTEDAIMIGGFITNVNIIDIDIGAGYTDPSTGETKHWSLRHVLANVVSGVTSYFDQVTSGNKVTLTVTSTDDTGHLTAIIWGDLEPRWAGDYGSAPTKQASAAEGTVPYAWAWLQETQAIRGDSFATFAGSFTQMENIASARVWACVQRCAERHAASQLPIQAHQHLAKWVNWLGLSSINNRDWQLRQTAQSMYALTIAGPSATAIDAALTAVFGDAFVETHRYIGTLDTPPANTFWPAGDVGPGSLDIGGVGPWSSRRYHYTFELEGIGIEQTRLLGLAHRDMDAILTAAMSPVCTWNYTFSEPGHFIFGTSDKLGRNCL